MVANSCTDGSLSIPTTLHSGKVSNIFWLYPPQPKVQSTMVVLLLGSREVMTSFNITG